MLIIPVVMYLLKYYNIMTDEENKLSGGKLNPNLITYIILVLLEIIVIGVFYISVKCYKRSCYRKINTYLNK